MKIENSYNQEYFTREQVEQGLHLNFIKTLLELDGYDRDGVHDIHIYL